MQFILVILELPWHLIFGGSNGSAIKSVELYNWKTGDHCQLDDLPEEARGHAAVTLTDGTVVYCGGWDKNSSAVTACYQKQLAETSWFPVRTTCRSH